MKEHLNRHVLGSEIPPSPPACARSVVSLGCTNHRRNTAGSFPHGQARPASAEKELDEYK